MRVVESVGFYFPDSVGGSEVYVSSLAKNLQSIGIECVIAAPHLSSQASCYVHEGLKVFRYPYPERSRRDEVQGRGPPRDFAVFEAWLRDQRAEVYHQHSWTTGCGAWHLDAAKRLGLRTVVTVHVPGNICMRGTMLFEGRVACDGKILPRRCASCWLQAKGLSSAVAKSLAVLPEGFGPLARLPKFGPALAAKALAANRRRSLHGMFAATDRVVAVCEWLRDALLANGGSPTKVVLSRQGVRDDKALYTAKPAKKSSSDILRFGFVGRWDPVKGIHLLINSFKRLPRSLSVELKILAASPHADGKEYRDSVQCSALDDSRIHFLSEDQSRGSAQFLASIDVLMVPSQWLETGPLVVLEAFAAGKPIIGSDLGGIKELVIHERNGLLVPHADGNAWTAAMMRVASDRGLLERLRQGIGPVRTMADVAHDMAQLYRELFEVKSYAA